MRLPVRLAHHHPLRKALAAALIGGIAMLSATTAQHIPGVSIPMVGLNNTLYDAFYHFRKAEDRTQGNVVIVTADEDSLAALAQIHLSWPLPRVLWGKAAKFVESQGARAVIFDITFQEPSSYDEGFAEALDQVKIPKVMGSLIDATGHPAPFAPQLAAPPVFGAVNILNDTVIREYVPVVNGVPSLAARTVEMVGQQMPAWGGAPFRLHYYGPNEWRDKGQVRRTYTYVSAWKVFRAEHDHTGAAELGVGPETFRNKIVIFGATAAGTYDLKSSPIAPLYPGVEVQATAIDNLLCGQVVMPVSALPAAGTTLVASLLAAIGVVLPRRAWQKVIAAVVALALLIGIAVAWFVGPRIHWLPMATPLLALLIATVAAFAWSYLVEDRQRRLVLKALGQYVSPAIAADIERNPDSLKLGGQRREMTVMFTDIQGFTDLSESMESEKLSEMLNFYLGEMSNLILANNGTLDKYIGDAIMSFWNAPILQPNHAGLACRAALAMRDREAEIQPQLAALGAPGMLTRIGINTGPMIFGNMGAPQKFNYSVLGDSVNLGSRLEGANKFYGSRILVAESTASELNGQFVLRRLDLMRVKGKLKPVTVFELMAEGPGDAPLLRRVALYTEAFSLYQAQKWDQAQAVLEELLSGFADDLPAAALKKRIEQVRQHSLPTDWDGVYIAKDK